MTTEGFLNEINRCYGRGLSVKKDVYSIVSFILQLDRLSKGKLLLIFSSLFSAIAYISAQPANENCSLA